MREPLAAPEPRCGSL